MYIYVYTYIYIYIYELNPNFNQPKLHPGDSPNSAVQRNRCLPRFPTSHAHTSCDVLKKDGPVRRLKNTNLFTPENERIPNASPKRK